MILSRRNNLSLWSLHPDPKISIVAERSSWVPKKSDKTMPTPRTFLSGTNFPFAAAPSSVRFPSGHPPQWSWLGCTANTTKRNPLSTQLKDCRSNFTWRLMQSSSRWPLYIALRRACFSMNFVISNRQFIRRIRRDYPWPRGYARRSREARMQGSSGKCFECL